MVEQPKGRIKTKAGPSRYLSVIRLLMAAIVYSWFGFVKCNFGD
jgi:hypothetical protein